MQNFLKFLVVGTIGFIINTVVLVTGVKAGFKPSVSGPLGAEIAIISNFLLNNFWTFSDRTITSWSVLPKNYFFEIIKICQTTNR
ncbi:GtrA family protein [Candidatus Gottesmanbacteria bacterium]|nr:GtrA family protein [Candidatus Gottesmanbacteria bacterium]